MGFQRLRQPAQLNARVAHGLVLRSTVGRELELELGNSAALPLNCCARVADTPVDVCEPAIQEASHRRHWCAEEALEGRHEADRLTVGAERRAVIHCGALPR